jgi:predicted nucleic acid-binding protein
VSGFLLDTNVISELLKPRPEPKVTTWLDSTDEELIFLSVLTIGEIRKGINLHPDALRRAKLESFLASQVQARFERRILPVDSAIAERWGLLTAKAKTEKGHTLPVIDGLFAATAQHHNLTLVTRNTRDVEPTGVQLFNPWQD